MHVAENSTERNTVVNVLINACVCNIILQTCKYYTLGCTMYIGTNKLRKVK